MNDQNNNFNTNGTNGTNGNPYNYGAYSQPRPTYTVDQNNNSGSYGNPYGQSPYGQQPQQNAYSQPQQDPYAQPYQDPYAQPHQDPYAQPHQDPYAPTQKEAYCDKNEPSKGQAIKAMVFGIIGAYFAWYPFLSIAGIIFGLLGRKQGTQIIYAMPAVNSTRNFAKAGRITGNVGFIAGIIMSIFWVLYYAIIIIAMIAGDM